MKRKNARKFAIYARVSTEYQAMGGIRNSVSIEFQIDSIKEYAYSLGFTDEDILIYVDEGFSAKNQKRPALQELLCDASNDKISHVCVYKLDRISRSLRDFLDLADFFKETQISFTSISEAFDTSTAFGNTIFYLIGCLAELEIRTTSERVINVMLAMAREGKYIVAKVPFGFRWDDGSNYPVPDERESLIVQRIFQLYGEGKSTVQIAKLFMQEQIYRRSSDVWDAGFIAKVLRNDFYIGTYRYNIREKGRGKLKDESEWIVIPDNHKGIVDKELFKKCNDMLDTKKHVINTKRVTVFGELLFCTSCANLKHSTPMRDKNFKSIDNLSAYRCKPNLLMPCKEKRSNDIIIGYVFFSYLQNVITLRDIYYSQMKDTELEDYLLSGEALVKIQHIESTTLSDIRYFLEHTKRQSNRLKIGGTINHDKRRILENEKEVLMSASEKLLKIRKYVIEGWFEHGHEGIYGYHVHELSDSSRRNTLQHRDLGTSIFTESALAERKAQENANGLFKYTSSILKENTIECRSFGKIYRNAQKSWMECKTIALTQFGIYIKERYCYPFLHIYSDVMTAKKKYDQMCQKAFCEYSSNCYTEELFIHYEYEDVYRVSESKYSALEYAYNHGSPYGVDSKFVYGKLVMTSSDKENTI